MFVLKLKTLGMAGYADSSLNLSFLCHITLPLFLSPFLPMWRARLGGAALIMPTSVSLLLIY